MFIGFSKGLKCRRFTFLYKLVVCMRTYLTDQKKIESKTGEKDE